MSSSTTTAPSCQPLASVFRDVTDVFRDVTDPRDRRGVRHDPPTILCLGCDGDPATYITRSSRTTRRSPLAIRARTAVRLMDVAAAILGGRNVRRPHRIPPPSMTNASPPPDPEGYSGVVRVVLVGLVGLAGAGRVQICHKGAPRQDRPRMKPRNINDSLPAFRLDSGLCGRFGQPAPPRAPWGGRSPTSARSMTSVPARAPAWRAVVDRAGAPFDRAGPARAPPRGRRRRPDPRDRHLTAENVC